MFEPSFIVLRLVDPSEESSWDIKLLMLVFCLFISVMVDLPNWYSLDNLFAGSPSSNRLLISYLSFIERTTRLRLGILKKEFTFTRQNLVYRLAVTWK